MKVIGAVVFAAGVGIFAGNITGAFPTFPGLGYITILAGAWLYNKSE